MQWLEETEKDEEHKTDTFVNPRRSQMQTEAEVLKKKKKKLV